MKANAELAKEFNEAIQAGPTVRPRRIKHMITVEDLLLESGYYLRPALVAYLNDTILPTAINSGIAVVKEEGSDLHRFPVRFLRRKFNQSLKFIK